MERCPFPAPKEPLKAVSGHLKSLMDSGPYQKHPALTSSQGTARPQPLLPLPLGPLSPQLL